MPTSAPTITRRLRTTLVQKWCCRDDDGNVRYWVLQYNVLAVDAAGNQWRGVQEVREYPGGASHWLGCSEWERV